MHRLGDIPAQHVSEKPPDNPNAQQFGCPPSLPLFPAEAPDIRDHRQAFPTANLSNLQTFQMVGYDKMVVFISVCVGSPEADNWSRMLYFPFGVCALLCQSGPEEGYLSSELAQAQNHPLHLRAHLYEG